MESEPQETQEDDQSFEEKVWWKVVWHAKDEFIVERVVCSEEEEDALFKAFCSFKDTDISGGFWITIFMLDMQSELSRTLVSHFPINPSIGGPEWKSVGKRICKTLGYDDTVSIMTKLVDKKIVTIRELPSGHVLA